MAIRLKKGHDAPRNTGNRKSFGIENKLARGNVPIESLTHDRGAVIAALLKTGDAKTYSEAVQIWNRVSRGFKK